MKKYFLSLGFVCLIVCAKAQEQTYVTLGSQTEHSVALNPFSHNWEISLGLQGLSFYSNQETPIELPKNLFKGFRTNFGVSASIAKWFSPEIGLRTKASGYWGKSVSTTDKHLNAIKYVFVHEDVIVNLSNILYGYTPEHNWAVSPYAGVGFVRNFTHNENALTVDLGLINTYRITKNLKVFCDLSFNITGDEFDTQAFNSNNIFKNHDRWVAAEIGVIIELGQNRWRRVPEIEDLEIVPWETTRCELKQAQSEIKKLHEQIENCNKKDESAAPTIISLVPETSIFFEIGSAELKYREQLENIKHLVQTALNEDRTIIVVGYADSSTGNIMSNEKLSAKRADTIVKELLEMGVDRRKIKTVIGGGVNTLNPIPANRRVVVSLE